MLKFLEFHYQQKQLKSLDYQLNIQQMFSIVKMIQKKKQLFFEMFL